MGHWNLEQGQSIEVRYECIGNEVLVIQKQGQAAEISIPVTGKVEYIGHVPVFKRTAVDMFFQEVTGQVTGGIRTINSPAMRVLFPWRFN